MKILITGAAGFIGHHVAMRFAKEGHTIYGIDNLSDYYDVNLKLDRLKEQGLETSLIAANKILPGKSNINFIKMDILDLQNLLVLFREQKFDMVIHMAAQAGVRSSLSNPQPYIDTNITGFLNILECCKTYPVKHLLYASSSSVYGLNKTIPFSESDSTQHPISIYAVSKKANELMAHTYSHLYKIPTTGLRFFTVYGPYGRPDMALFMFTKNIIEGQPIDVFNNGIMKRDFTYIDDIVEGVYRISQKPAEGESNFNPLNPNPAISTAPYKIYNIGNNSPVNLLDFIAAIETELGLKATFNFKPMQPGDVQTNHANSENLIRAIYFKPNTPIKEGISKFISWYKSYYQV